jgi:hypothetical protein
LSRAGGTLAFALPSEGVHAIVIPSEIIWSKQMEQAASPNNDDLPQLRVNFNEATQALLLQMDAPRSEFRLPFARVQYDAKILSEALLRAAPHVTMELGEAYTLEGNTLPASTYFLCTALLEFRKRKGIHL